ncbi:hypothetical protein NITLEN_100026 [Nitrospira lenta]|uniref:Uncharacterized protein n=1 Tax=Nitrospira lenta TaxID=1436998 RepID=A0A330L2X0_9BACT|nr:hypothetical protein NITLEN_100026 [Nitrospira lenta]
MCTSGTTGAVPQALSTVVRQRPLIRRPQHFRHEGFMVYVCHQAPDPARIFLFFTDTRTKPDTPSRDTPLLQIP